MCAFRGERVVAISKFELKSSRQVSALMVYSFVADRNCLMGDEHGDDLLVILDWYDWTIHSYNSMLELVCQRTVGIPADHMTGNSRFIFCHCALERCIEEHVIVRRVDTLQDVTTIPLSTEDTVRLVQIAANNERLVILTKTRTMVVFELEALNCAKSPVQLTSRVFKRPEYDLFEPMFFMTNTFIVFLRSSNRSQLLWYDCSTGAQALDSPSARIHNLRICSHIWHVSQAGECVIFHVRNDFEETSMIYVKR